MAQPVPGSERIRAIQDPDGMYKAFDSYPWAKDKTFQSGLYAILGDPNSPNPKGEPSELALHARIFYYAQRIGVSIDFGSYKSWLADHPDHTPPDVLPEGFSNAAAASSSTSSSNAVPAWQSSAPKADLYVEKGSTSQPESDASAAGGDEPNYPMGFAEMLQRLQTGAPIPGIREIPDTVIRDPSVKPFGARAAPKKPWERDIPQTTGPSSSSIDSSFPPLDDEPSNSGT